MTCNRTRRGRIARAAIATLIAALLGGAATSQAAVGVKIIVQGWEPWNDNRQPTTVPIDDPKLISEPLMNAWARAQGPLCDAMAKELGRPDRIRRGITLYNISCRFNAADVRMVNVSKTRARLVVLLPASRISATSTTPNASQLGADLPLIGDIGLPGATDPRFEVAVDAQFEVDVEIGDAPAPLLTVRKARFNLKHADAGGVNITGKLGEWVASKVVPFFGGPDFERMAEGLIDGLGVDALGPVRQAVKIVNTRLAPYAKHVRVGVWVSASRIALAVQPRNLPTPVLGGAMFGRLTDQRSGLQPVDPRLCAGLRVSAEYQAGPRPILDPDRLDELGPARMVPVGNFVPAQSFGSGCEYAVQGLAIGVTNTVRATHVLAGRGSSGSLIRMGTVLLHPGWDGSSVVPRNVVSNRNYVLASDMRGEAVVVQRDPRRARIDPIENPLLKMKAPVTGRESIPDRRLDPSINVLTGAARIGGIAPGPGAIGAKQALNPQPLPPRALNPQPLPPKAPIAVLPAAYVAAPVLKPSNGSALAIGSATGSITAGRLAVLH